MRNQPGNSRPKSSHKGLIIALSIVGGLVLLMGLAVGGGVWYMRGMVRRLTATEPMSLPVTELNQTEQQKVKRNVQRFYTACQKGQADRIEFDSRELNGLIGGLDDCRSMRGKVAVEIVDGVPWVQASIPLNDTGVSWLQGRYLNGKLRLNVQMKETGLSVTVAEIVVPGGEVPEWMVKRIQEMDWGTQISQDKEWGPRIRRLESLELNQDKLVVQTKKGG